MLQAGKTRYDGAKCAPRSATSRCVISKTILLSLQILWHRAMHDIISFDLCFPLQTWSTQSRGNRHRHGIDIDVDINNHMLQTLFNYRNKQTNVRRMFVFLEHLFYICYVIGMHWAYICTSPVIKLASLVCYIVKHRLGKPQILAVLCHYLPAFPLGSAVREMCGI